MSVDKQAARQQQAGSVVRGLQRFFMRMHVSLYRITNGTLGGKGAGRVFLILTTTGRKSGVERDTPLSYFPDGKRFVVIASNGGAVKHPTWWLNLQSHPEARVQVGHAIVPVTAGKAEGEERERLWSAITNRYKNFADYQKRVSREIPVVVLTPNE